MSCNVFGGNFKDHSGNQPEDSSGCGASVYYFFYRNRKNAGLPPVFFCGDGGVMLGGIPEPCFSSCEAFHCVPLSVRGELGAEEGAAARLC